MNNHTVCTGASRDKFDCFHGDNPHIYKRLVQMTRLLVRKGQTQIGMGMLFEVLRWEIFIQSETDSPYTLDNTLRAYYTRLIESQEPDLCGVFTKRRSAADVEVAA
jgi:hypothetical protein